VAIDLHTASWPCYQLPYLASLHCSAITATTHISNVPQTLWDKMTDAGQRQLIGYSMRVGGACVCFVCDICSRTEFSKPLMRSCYYVEMTSYEHYKWLSLICI